MNDAADDGILSAPHVMEYPYRRSLGPVLGRFFSGLREGRIEANKTTTGRVLVPPMEYDPDTGEDVSDDWVEVGPGAVVTSWTWIPEPRACHPSDVPFAYALVALDGADTAMLSVVRAADESAMRTGMRVTVRFAAERTGQIQDIDGFVPEASLESAKSTKSAKAAKSTGSTDSTAAGPTSDSNEPVKSIVTPSRVAYEYTPGVAPSRFLANLARGKIIGQACPKCEMVYVPTRGACARCGVATERDVEVSDKGTLVTYSIIRVPSANIDIELPYVGGQVLLDGSHLAFHCLIRNVDVETVRMGMRVQARWKPESEWGPTFENIEFFEPIDEPDVPYEQYKDLF